MSKLLVLRLPDDLYESIEDAAKEDGMIPAVFVRGILEEAFEFEENKE